MMIGYALLVGLLVAVGTYLLVHRAAFDKVLGLVVLGHAANLFVLGAGGLVRGHAALLPAGATADPLPQALVLTAIVIGFGLVAFAIVLVARLHRAEAAAAKEKEEAP